MVPGFARDPGQGCRGPGCSGLSEVARWQRHDHEWAGFVSALQHDSSRTAASKPLQPSDQTGPMPMTPCWGVVLPQDRYMGRRHHLRLPAHQSSTAGRACRRDYSVREPENADSLTLHAWEYGTPTANPNIRIFDFQRPIGTGFYGGSQTQVRVSINSRGEIHGSPWGPELP